MAWWPSSTLRHRAPARWPATKRRPPVSPATSPRRLFVAVSLALRAEARRNRRHRRRDRRRRDRRQRRRHRRRRRHPPPSPVQAPPTLPACRWWPLLLCWLVGLPAMLRRALSWWCVVVVGGGGGEWRWPWPWGALLFSSFPFFLGPFIVRLDRSPGRFSILVFCSCRHEDT